jgi:hypothetical protein
MTHRLVNVGFMKDGVALVRSLSECIGFPHSVNAPYSRTIIRGSWKAKLSLCGGLDLRTRCMSAATFTPRPLYPWVTHPCGTHCVGWPQSRSAYKWSREISVVPAGNWTPALQLVARRYTDCCIPTPQELVRYKHFTPLLQYKFN